MNYQDFCFWLQGFNEISQTPPTPEQWKVIQDHLALVFNKVTPARITAENVFPDGKNCGDTTTYCSGLDRDRRTFIPPQGVGPFPLKHFSPQPSNFAVATTC